MPNHGRQFGTDIQPSLFSSDTDSIPGSDHLGHVVRGVITKVCRESRFSRVEITDRMSDLLGTKVTVRMLNDWTAESKELHRFPLEYVAAFCHATETFDLIAAVVSRCGAQVISRKDAGLLDFAQAAINKEVAERTYAYRFAALMKEGTVR